MEMRLPRLARIHNGRHRVVAADARLGAVRSQRVVVTGSAGFIGSHLCERLLATGHDVVGVDCFTDYYSPLLKALNSEPLREHPRFSLVRADLGRDPLDGLLEGVDTVYHLAGQPGVRGSFGDEFETYVHNNVLATQRLLEACARQGTRRIVYASSSSVYGDAARFPTRESCDRKPRSPYGLTKLATEELSGIYERGDGLETVGLRYFTVYGPRQRPDMAFTRFIAAGIEGKPLEVLDDGAQVRDFTYVDDAVTATIAAAERGRSGLVYNVGGGTQVRLRDALALIEDLLEKPLQIRHLPRARGDVRRTCSDPRRAMRDLRFRPTTELRAGLESQVDWALAQSGAVCSAVAG
jgi:UDP-glucuronate 4-epimerase